MEKVETLTKPVADAAPVKKVDGLPPVKKEDLHVEERKELLRAAQQRVETAKAEHERCRQLYHDGLPTETCMDKIQASMVIIKTLL